MLGIFCLNLKKIKTIHYSYLFTYNLVLTTPFAHLLSFLNLLRKEYNSLV